MISPLYCLANSMLSFVFPTAVGPIMTTNFCLFINDFTLPLAFYTILLTLRKRILAGFSPLILSYLSMLLEHLNIITKSILAYTVVFLL